MENFIDITYAQNIIILPDKEFIVNLNNQTLVKKTDEIYPIFSACESHDTNDFLIPLFHLTFQSVTEMEQYKTN